MLALVRNLLQLFSFPALLCVRISGLSLMGNRGAAFLGHDDEWHLPKAGMAGIDFEMPLETFEDVHGRVLGWQRRHVISWLYV